MQKLTIEKIFEPKMFGNFNSVSIFFKEFPNVYISGPWEDAKEWKKGQEVEVIISEKEKNGKIYKNFSLPKKVDLASEEIRKLSNRVTTLEMSESRREEEFQRWMADMTIDVTGKINTSGQLARSDKNVQEVKETLGIDDGEPEF